MLEYIKNETIPHEVLEEFRAAGTVFYDGMPAFPGMPTSAMTGLHCLQNV
jgi:hypothetical protein